MAMGVYLLSHWLKFSLHLVAQFQRDSYDKFNYDEVIVRCDWTKDLFVNSSDPSLIKRAILRQAIPPCSIPNSAS